MNVIQQKSNQFLREAILEGNVEKARRYLTLKLGKADMDATTDNGGFSMLHCAALTGNTQIILLLLQLGANRMALTDDGYSALDLAIWKNHLQIIELLRAQGCIAPMKEPESLNGYVILHLNQRATVVDYDMTASIRPSRLRALYFEQSKQGLLVHLWAGLDYRIIGYNPRYMELRKHEYRYVDYTDPNYGRSYYMKQLELDERYDTMLQGQAFIDNDSDSEEENELEEVVQVEVPPGPLGVLLDSGIQECAVVHGFVRLANDKVGPIESHGSVLPGMYIMSINHINASLMSLEQVTELLRKLHRKHKVLRFAVFKTDSDNQTDDTLTTASALSSPAKIQIAPIPELSDSPHTSECTICGLDERMHKSGPCPYK